MSLVHGKYIITTYDKNKPDGYSYLPNKVWILVLYLYNL